VIDTLTAWWETDFHDDAARAALAYTEAITRVADATVADDFGVRHDALAEHFSQEEILEIIGIVINSTRPIMTRRHAWSASAHRLDPVASPPNLL
jgi:alkylhydroperoxidase family enzyme